MFTALSNISCFENIHDDGVTAGCGAFRMKKTITNYVEATLLAADHDCLYLYEQGAKDCVALLKKLEVL